LCPDRCAEIHQQYEERKRVEAENVQRGLAGREKLVKEAFRIKEAIKKDIHDLTVELEQTEQRLLLEQQELDESMIAAQQVGQSPQALRAKELVEKLDNERNIAKSAVTALIDRLTTVENMLNSFKEKYDPVQEDPVITDLITTWELLSSQWSAVEESSDHTSYQEIADAIDNIQLPVPINMSLKQRFPFLTRARLWLAEQGLAAYPSESTNFAESPFTRKLKQTVEATERSISDLKRNCENKKQELDKDYGPDDVLLGLRDDCAKGHFGDYDYEVCFLKSVTQDGNGHRSNLGNYASYSQDPVSGTLMFSFENGAKCWSGQIRQSRVQVTCGEENKILSVTEPEKCEYHMKLISPAACIAPSNSGNKNETGKESSSPVEHPDL
jgi:protein kinase C substrate 80K-H